MFRKTNPKKGQFFIFGAILLVVVFFLGLPFIKPVFTSPSNDLPYISKNIKSEFPVALNLGLNESLGIQKLKNFSLFLENSLEDNSITFTTLWVVASNSSSDANFTVGNFLNTNITVSFNISSTTQQVFVPINQTNSTVFSGPGSIFNITISSSVQDKEIQILRDKVSLYAFYELKRGPDLVREEIIS